jgi:hypothetical protein
LPSGSLPPAAAKVGAPPPHADALMAAQRTRINKEIRAQA